jgi:tetratricopeptide (TPR) repeat protein
MTDELEDQLIAKTEELEVEHKPAEAVETATELARLDPKDAIVWFIKGKAHYVAGEFEESLSCLARAAEIEKERPEIWHMMGYSLISLQRYEEAKDALQYACDRGESNVEARTVLSFVQFMLGKNKEGTANFKLAVDQNPVIAWELANHFYEKFLSKSDAITPTTKSIVERTIETLKLLKVQNAPIS